MTSIPRPPIPPPLHRWPQAVQSAEVLRGSAVKCGPGLRLVSWPETPTVRAAAIADQLSQHRIAAHLTAAWIWGAAREPDNHLEFVVTRGRAHVLNPLSNVALHQYRLSKADITRLGPYSTTSLKRTLYDLLRGDTFELRHRVACRMLLSHSDVDRSNVTSELPLRRRPFETRMRRRLEEL